ncbi:RNA polymerase sigma-70 factor [Mariniflexile litorale]|uniref:RNA polymerase sigma-70 factor n=1 Tax=Mariniflexile litorale TaxID=3045158 RepID=A0AAU7E8V0_9FLAO|nr:RNA polymerase sigma-70 factor [Mariniflexile sp. KMM 9835]MDQ8210572.1 RNA polymerase sigma-70 factor [Mariniflexile sp. KMM 9835]
MKSNDLKILRELKQGSPDAFKELFDLYYIPLSTYALKYCDSFSIAEDIVQDLFIKLWDEKLYLNFDEIIGPYLFKAVKNNTLQAIKQKSRYHFVEIEELVNKLIIDENIDIKFIEEDKKKLYTEIEALPTKCKEVFKAIVLDNLKYKEVALQHGISINTVKTHYSRALKQLRNVLGIIILLLIV